MAYVFGIPALVLLVVLVYGGLTGRVRLTSCRAVADPRRDLRMRPAFEDDALPPDQATPGVGDSGDNGDSIDRGDSGDSRAAARLPRA